MTPEFSRPERLDTIGTADRTVTVEATAAERAALAVRFDLLSLDALAAEWTIRRAATDGGAAGVAARGRVRAVLAQRCSVTGDPVPAEVDEAVRLLFVPEGTEAAQELELSDDAADTVFFAGNAIDLGEAAAETLALAIDPFPRSAGADAALRQAGVRGDDEPDAGGTFGALAALRDRLS